MRKRREKDSFERTSLASRPLRISFAVTDIRHGQRSSSSGRRRRRRRRNRETEKKRKKRQKHKTSKKAADTLDMHTGHIFRPLAASLSSCPSSLSLARSLSLPRAHSSSTSSIVSTQHPTSREKAHTGASRLFLFNGRGQNKPPPTATPISSRHAVTRLRTLIHNATRVTRSCETRPSSELHAFVRKIHE